jgi:predicted nucleic acid-binding Zn ribbon protein
VIVVLPICFLLLTGVVRTVWAVGSPRGRFAVPVYVYRRRDGSSFELEQRITEDALVSCPTTGQTVERVLQPFTPRYRGTGFYSTDHRKPKAEGRAGA